MKDHFTLITGASRGLGKAMTLEMAKRKENLVLVALPDSGLKSLSDFVEDHYQVIIHTLEIDLSVSDNYFKISQYIEDHNIKIKYLINNAGVLSRGSFDQLDHQFILDQIEVNVSAPTLLISLLLNNLKQNKGAGILNVSSLASYFSLPQKQVYCGTKAYLSTFSNCLRKELKPYNISVSVVCPGGLNTTTRLCYQNRILGLISRESVLSPEEAARISIDGMMQQKGVIVPGFINKCFLFINKILPKFIKDKLTEREISKFPTPTYNN
jgi:short-subunit dehydrogenase